VVLPRARVEGFLARVRTGAAQREEQLEKVRPGPPRERAGGRAARRTHARAAAVQLAREMRAAALGAGTDFVERQRAATLTAEGQARIMARPDVEKQRQRVRTFPRAPPRARAALSGARGAPDLITKRLDAPRRHAPSNPYRSPY